MTDINNIDRIQACGTEIGVISTKDGVKTEWLEAEQIVHDLVYFSAFNLVWAAQNIAHANSEEIDLDGLDSIRLQICGIEMLVFDINNPETPVIEVCGIDASGIALFDLSEVLTAIVRLRDACKKLEDPEAYANAYMAGWDSYYKYDTAYDGACNYEADSDLLAQAWSRGWYAAEANRNAAHQALKESMK